jgi:hypothetical protein
MAFTLVEADLSQLSSIINKENSQGNGIGEIGPGTVLNQAMLLGAQNYLLHYDLEADGPVRVAYLSRKQFMHGVEAINNTAIENYVDYLCKLPGFEAVSRSVARKMIYTSRMVSTPVGTRFESTNRNKKLFHILRGEFLYEFTNLQAKQNE